MKRHECLDDDNYSKIWGCKSPVSISRWELLCHRCLGRNKSCDVCNGKGRIPQPRCINSTLTYKGQEGFKAYRLFKEYKILPVSGGMYEQSAYFMNVLELCDSINYIMEEDKQKNAEILKRMASNGNETRNRNITGSKRSNK